MKTFDKLILLGIGLYAFASILDDNKNDCSKKEYYEKDNIENNENHKNCNSCDKDKYSKFIDKYKHKYDYENHIKSKDYEKDHNTESKDFEPSMNSCHNDSNTSSIKENHNKTTKDSNYKMDQLANSLVDDKNKSNNDEKDVINAIKSLDELQTDIKRIKEKYSQIFSGYDNADNA